MRRAVRVSLPRCAGEFQQKGGVLSSIQEFIPPLRLTRLRDEEGVEPRGWFAEGTSASTIEWLVLGAEMVLGIHNPHDAVGRIASEEKEFRSAPSPTKNGYA